MSAQRRFKSWEEAVCWLREQPQSQTLVRDAYYDDPLIDAAERYWRSEEWQAVRAVLPQAGGRALDVGAGRGIASLALARDGFSVTALEPDPSAVVGAEAIRRLTETSNLPIAVVEDVSARLPFADGSFDLVFARAVLHHIPDLDAACREFHRILKPGGRLVAIREHVISRPSDLPSFLDAHPLHHLYGGENALMLDSYLSAIKKAGFAVARVLAPLDSPINYAPQTLSSLRAAIAERLTGPLPALRSVATALLGLPPLWRALVPVMNRLDHRPGRHYSFIADRS